MDFRKSNFAKNKSAAVPEVSATAASALVIVIGIAIVLYVILIPPEARQQLLGDSPYYPLPGQNPSSEIVDRSLMNKTLVLENIGEVDFVKQRDIEHNIPAINLYTKTSGSVIKEINSLYIKKTLFSEDFKTLDFDIKDVQNTENVILNFLVKNGVGRLIIKLNGFEIFNNEVSTVNIKPIEIDKGMLKQQNTLEFQVDNPGFFFWKVNEYTLEKVTVNGDITDTTRREASGLFYIEPEERNNAEKVVLQFYPDCSVKTVGRLTASINDREIYGGVPSCNVLNKQEFSVNYVEAGNNKVTFFAESGDYYIDNIKVTSSLKEPDSYIYYFNMDQDYFNEMAGDAVCGDIDGACPDDCSADLDKDCCFEASTKNYWCDAVTGEIDDRCVGSVSYDRCQLCSTGYESKDGTIVDACKNLCGDDKDGICPIGCTAYADKDCCYLTQTNYWCDDVPKQTGLQGVCRQSVSKDECNYCVKGYKNKKGESPGCSTTKTVTASNEFKLRSKYNVDLSLKFVHDNENKKGELVINDNKFFFDSTDDLYERNIDAFLRPNYNVVQLVPKSSMNVIQLEVKLDER